MMNLTREQMIAENFTESQIAMHLKRQNTSASTPTRGSANVGSTKGLRNAVMTIVAKNPDVSDIDVIRFLRAIEFDTGYTRHEVAQENEYSDRAAISRELLKLFNDGIFSRDEMYSTNQDRDVYHYSLS